MENFSGLSAQVVLKEICAKSFMVNLTAILTLVAPGLAERLCQTWEHDFQVSFVKP